MSRRAAKGIWFLFLALFLLVILRLGWLMLFQHEALSARAEAQQIRTFPYYAYERGSILDRYGRSLTDQPEHCAVVFPSMLYDEDAAVELLSDVLDESASVIRSHLADDTALTALILKTGLDAETAESLQQGSVSGITSLILPARYDADRTAVHVIGSCNQQDGIWHGISGLEAEYDGYLSGRADADIMAFVDARGAFSNEQMYLIPGKEDYHSLHLTLDRDIQQIAERAMEQHGYHGACVVMEPQTGDVLAMVSAPDYDPYYWETPGEGDYLNKALSFYAPASTFKTVLAAAALSENIPLPVSDGSETFICSGSYQLPDGHQVFCTSALEGHGELTLAEALSCSCNCCFVALGQPLGGDTIRRYADLLGYDAQRILGYDTASAAGRIRFPASVPASVANASLGEEGVAVSPLQQAAAYCTFVNGGKRVTPRLVTAVTKNTGDPVLTVEPEEPTQVISPETAAEIRKMLLQTVSEGTGKGAKAETLVTGGKTGTGETDGVWFCGFVEENGKALFVISVYIENGTAGGVEAASVFKEIVDDIDRFME